VIYLRVITRGEPRPEVNIWMRKMESQTSWNVGYTRYPYSVALARNLAFKEARDAGAEYLVMVDDDVVPDRNIVTLPEHALPVVGGLVPMNKEGLICLNAFHLSEEGIYWSLPGAGEGLREVYAVGAAILCVKIDEIPFKAPFSFDLDEDGLIGPLGGEDISFCRRCHEHNIPIWVDTDYVGEHFSRIALGEALVRGNPNVAGPSVFKFDAGEYLGDLAVGRSYRSLLGEGQRVAERERETAKFAAD
jgi:hypothetical protein